ncbi:hypothetical protein I3760_16G112400 [Carya illinoinensis]|nr:hypothetical protein I3760_16G112400 [Carya illinoinensis]
MEPSKVPKPAYKGPWKCKGGIIFGADTRTIERPIITEKNYEKIHYMAPNIYCCGARTAADTKAITVSTSQLQLHRYHTGQESRLSQHSPSRRISTFSSEVSFVGNQESKVAFELMLLDVICKL